VGEREDRGELTEEEAMRHARRNEIYRDVGSGFRAPDDPAFIEIETFPMPSDGLLLLCSDGLTDLIGSAEILAGVERYSPDFDAVTRALIDAANHAGGKDNITIVIAAGPDYGESAVSSPREIRTRKSGAAAKWIFLAVGLLFGLAAGFFAPKILVHYEATGPRTILAGQVIKEAMSQAHSGDIVIIPQGRYRERVDLREGVILRAQTPGAVTLLSPDGGRVVIARNRDSGGVEGVSVMGDLDAPAAAGLEIVDASPLISNVKIAGANVGIEIQGNSSPAIRASRITNNLGAGVLVAPGATPRIESNLIAANGNGQNGGAKPGVEVLERGHPVLKDNAIVNNGAEPVWIHGRTYLPADMDENFFGELTAKKAIRFVDAPVIPQKNNPAKDKIITRETPAAKSAAQGRER
jgi:hypothetical protein